MWSTRATYTDDQAFGFGFAWQHVFWRAWFVNHMFASVHVVCLLHDHARVCFLHQHAGSCEVSSARCYPAEACSVLTCSLVVQQNCCVLGPSVCCGRCCVNISHKGLQDSHAGLCTARLSPPEAMSHSEAVLCATLLQWHQPGNKAH